MSSTETQFLYLTTIGRKSGRQHQIEIWFVDYNGRYYLVAEMEERAHWVRNVQQNPAISFRVSGETFRGTARIINRQAEPELARQVSARMDAKYDWSDGLIVELTPG